VARRESVGDCREKSDIISSTTTLEEDKRRAKDQKLASNRIQNLKQSCQRKTSKEEEEKPKRDPRRWGWESGEDRATCVRATKRGL